MKEFEQTEQFLEKLFKYDACARNKSSILYPHEVGSLTRFYISKNFQVRQLSAESDEDSEFVKKIIKAP